MVAGFILTYHKVIQDMNRIDNEISRNRSQTNSDIQEEFYKIVTEWRKLQIVNRTDPNYNHGD